MDYLIFMTAFFGIFIFAGAVFYALLIFGFAFVYSGRGFTWREAIKKAVDFYK